MNIWDVIVSVSTAIAALIAAVAIWQNVQLHKQQQSLSLKIHEQQKLLSQRQLLIPLWEYLRKLNNINPQNPVWLDVINATNTLELVAVSWEGQLIDENIIRRVFSKQFIEFYQKIEECRNPPENIGLDGKKMLLECPAATRLYQLLIDEHINHQKLPPIS